MRYLIILLILFLSSLAAFSQTSENAKDTSDFFYYTQIQNALYKITNSNSTIENKRRDAYHNIYHWRKCSATGRSLVTKRSNGF